MPTLTAPQIKKLRENWGKIAAAVPEYAGVDPDTVSFEITPEGMLVTKPLRPESELDVFKSRFGRTIAPAGAAALATHVAMELLPQPATKIGRVAKFGTGLLTGGLTAAGVDEAQEMISNRGKTPMEIDRDETQRRLNEKKNPKSALAGSILGNALYQRLYPDKAALKEVGSIVRALKGANVGGAAESALDVAAKSPHLQSALLGGGTAAALEGVRQLRAGEFNPLDLAVITATSLGGPRSGVTLMGNNITSALKGAAPKVTPEVAATTMPLESVDVADTAAAQRAVYDMLMSAAPARPAAPKAEMVNPPEPEINPIDMEVNPFNNPAQAPAPSDNIPAAPNPALRNRVVEELAKADQQLAALPDPDVLEGDAALLAQQERYALQGDRDELAKWLENYDAKHAPAPEAKPEVVAQQPGVAPQPTMQPAAEVPAPETPAPVQPAVVPKPAAPDPQIAQLQAELAALKAKLEAQAPAPAVKPTPVIEPTPTGKHIAEQFPLPLTETPVAPQEVSAPAPEVTATPATPVDTLKSAAKGKKPKAQAASKSQAVLSLENSIDSLNKNPEWLTVEERMRVENRLNALQAADPVSAKDLSSKWNVALKNAVDKKAADKQSLLNEAAYYIEQFAADPLKVPANKLRSLATSVEAWMGAGHAEFKPLHEKLKKAISDAAAPDFYDKVRAATKQAAPTTEPKEPEQTAAPKSPLKTLRAAATKKPPAKQQVQAQPKTEPPKQDLPSSVKVIPASESSKEVARLQQAITEYEAELASGKLSARDTMATKEAIANFKKKLNVAQMQAAAAGTEAPKKVTGGLATTDKKKIIQLRAEIETFTELANNPQISESYREKARKSLKHFQEQLATLLGNKPASAPKLTLTAEQTKQRVAEIDVALKSTSDPAQRSALEAELNQLVEHYKTLPKGMQVQPNPNKEGGFIQLPFSNGGRQARGR